jgi:tetratricopeptide (TPR) repeat protein
MKWGNRRLEDDWRRNSKQNIEFETASTEEGITAESAPEGGDKKILSNKTREFYIQHIPRGDSAMEQSNLRLERALFEMGLVYRNDLGDNEEAIRIFEEQLSRYPDGNNSLMGAFNLYELYNLTGDKTKSDFYKNLIVRKYPDNPRAKILSDPDYAKQLLNEANRVNVFYEQTYDKYENADYNAVVNDVNYALTEFSGEKIIPRFRLLKALSTGGLAGKEAMKEELDELISDYPGHEVSTYATQLIDHIYSMAPELKVEDTRKAAEEIYSYKTEGQFFAGVSGSVGIDKNQLNFNLVNFNLDFYNRENLSLQQLTVGKRTIIIVRSFKDQESALAYLSRISENQETVFNSIDKADTELFIIGQENYDTLVKDNDFTKYRLFYQKYYSNND